MSRFVGIIVRRPHAYQFRDLYGTGAPGKGIAIPGMVLMSGAGEVLWCGTVERFREECRGWLESRQRGMP